MKGMRKCIDGVGRCCVNAINEVFLFPYLLIAVFYDLTIRTLYGTLLVEVTEMTTLTASKARAILYQLLDKVATLHEPIQITGKRHNAVLVSEEDWRAINETLYLLSIPKMRDSIREGMKTPLEECSEEPDW